jgi:hypothetical protein
MARRRNTATGEKSFRLQAYEVCLQRACNQVRALKDLLQAEVQLEKAAGRVASQTKKEERDVR